MLRRLPNVLTLSRIIAIPVVVALLFLKEPLASWLALTAYVCACVTDFFDGYFARAWKQQSVLGRFLDPTADKLMVAAVVLVLVADRRIDGISILPGMVILCREILVSGLREYLATLKVLVPVNRLSKWKTAIQMTALGFLLGANAIPTFGPVPTHAIGEVGLWGAAILTLVTGYGYLRVGLRHMQATEPRLEPRQAPPDASIRQPRRQLSDAG
ncbi:MAG: CDP-diacylglycerol--glycerol-3-phosphate 3-phosphatidyltransferase [Rhodospirillales bacterium]|nr:CDP-diacylglycerol--glycerol-3-phosphate 3-phosphatidyltransferase [Rhodospirillales bacterium]